MKALLVTTMIIAGSLAASTGYSQVYVRAHLNFGIPAPRVYCAPAPAPAPVAYEDEYGPATPEYAPGYAPAAEEYPVETYVNFYPNYPAWGGHYRDRVYFDHYRPFFDRYRNDHIREFNRFHEEHRGYEDHREQRGYEDHRGQGDHRGNENHGYENRGYDRHSDHSRR